MKEVKPDNIVVEKLEKNGNVLSFTKKIKMYLPKKYQKTDSSYIFDFINQHPFATVVSPGNRLMATHLPVLTEGTSDNFRLFSHLANHNEQLQLLKDDSEALLIFQGAQAYISSSWYKEKDISTWDYSAVHVNVRVRRQTEKELEESLIKLVHHFEKDQKSPLMYHDIPKPMLLEHLPLITGFWCEIIHMEAIAKLHQGYPKEDVISVMGHLAAQENPGARELKNDIQKEHGL